MFWAFFSFSQIIVKDYSPIITIKMAAHNIWLPKSMCYRQFGREKISRIHADAENHRNMYELEKAA